MPLAAPALATLLPPATTKGLKVKTEAAPPSPPPAPFAGAATSFFFASSFLRRSSSTANRQAASTNARPTMRPEVAAADCGVEKPAEMRFPAVRGGGPAAARELKGELEGELVG